MFSDKNRKITEHNIFKDGYLDKKILNDPRNIMPLPKEHGLHDTISVHKGRHFGKVSEDLAEQLDVLKSNIESGKITKENAEKDFFATVNNEKGKLFNGNIKLNNKG